MLDRLAHLVDRLGVRLTDVEACLLVVAPFLREAALAAGETAIRAFHEEIEKDPGATQPGSSPSPARQALQAVLGKYPQLHRKARRLSTEGDRDGFEAIAWWLTHEAALRLPEAWETGSGGGPGLFPCELEATLDSVQRLLPAVGGEPIVWLRDLARCLVSDPAALDDQGGAFARERRYPIADGAVAVMRPLMLARLLAMAGPMALDPRRLSPVVVDHLGLSDPTSPADLVGVCREAFWDADGTSNLVLRHSGIRHPAYHLALETLVEGLSARHAATLRAVAENGTGLAPLALLPAMRAELKPAQLRTGGGQLFDTPHVQFTLASAEVKELLMGEQLWDDPMLAVRELYQNALDACRYRHARLKAIAAREALEDGADGARKRYETLCKKAVDEWLLPDRAVIRFEQRLVGGRLMIECADDGVGMGRREIEQCFARAGRRFADSDEFLFERARWRDLEARLLIAGEDAEDGRRIEFQPNSQFGIGVFSYFMLAEELEVVTKRLHADGSAGPTLSARVSGSGGLFRIASAEKERQSCGTTVRLWLASTTVRVPEHTWTDERVEQRVSTFDTLRRLLRVAEYRTTVREEGRHERAWEPNVLSDTTGEGGLRPVLLGRLWWRVVGDEPRGFVLADGVETKETREDGLIVNLRRDRRPRLSVDRTKVIEADYSWLKDVLRVGGARPLAEGAVPSYWWLAKVAARHPRLMLDACEAMAGRGATMSAGKCLIPVAEGIWPPDVVLENAQLRMRHLGSPDSEKRDHLLNELLDRLGPPDLAKRRLMYWTDRGLASAIKLQKRISRQRGLPGGRLAQPPPLEFRWSPLNAVLISYKFDGRPPWLEGEVPPGHILRAAAKLGITVGEAHAGLAVFASIGLRLPPAPDAALASLRPMKDDITILSWGLDGREPWLEDEVPLRHILHAAAKLGITVGEAHTRLAMFASMGLRLPPAPEGRDTG